MIPPTQTMENTTEVEYISIYDKPKRGRGRPKTCTLTDEEKLERLRVNYKAYFNANPEKERERARLGMARFRESKKMKFRKPIIFLAFRKMNFYLKK